MKQSKFDRIEFYLGKNMFNGYDIIEHDINSPQGDGTCCFDVTDYWVSDGDGHPAHYDETYVKVSKEVYEYAMCMFKAAQNNLEISGKPIHCDRDIKVGDCIEIGGVFLNIVSISTNECRARSFYDDGYNINVDVEADTLENLDFTLEELKADGQLITKEIFDGALETAKDAIFQIKSYLDTQYKHNKQ